MTIAVIPSSTVFVGACLVVAVSVAIVAAWLARRRTHELATLRSAFRRSQLAADERLAAASARRDELEALLGAMVDGVLAVDNDGRLLRFNAAARPLLRAGVEPAGGFAAAEAIRSTPLLRLIRQVLDTGEADGIEIESAVGVADTPRRFAAQACTFGDAAGRRLGVVVVLHDITRIRQLEQVRQEFVGNVSHEIRTPIAAIRAAIETLLEDADRDATPGRARPMDPADAERMHWVIQRQTSRLEAIVSDLLMLSRLDAGADAGGVSDSEPVALAAVLAGTVEVCAARAAARGITLHVDTRTPLRVRGQPRLLEQALINLVDNAIKYSPDRSPVHVEVKGDADGRVSVSVRDRGRGIDAAHLPRIFERFYRTDAARSRKLGGTGLGLSIVKHIAELHGGSVRAESRVGVGSVFTLQLQAADTLQNPATDKAGAESADTI